MARAKRTRQEQKAATRALFLRVGRRVFAKHGFDATSVATLCRAARTTHGALYHHFRSKQELFAAVLEELTQELAGEVLRATSGAVGWGQVEAACRAYLDACTDPEVQQLLFRDGPRALPGDAFSALDRGTNEPLVTGLLAGWIEAGLLAAQPVTLVARMLGGAFAEAGAVIAEADDPRTVRRQAEQVMLGWLGSLRAPR